MKIDPKMNKCTNCSWTFKFNKFDLLRMLLFGDVLIVCPKCLTKMEFRLVFHTAKVSTDKVRKELWRKC